MMLFSFRQPIGKTSFSRISQNYQSMISNCCSTLKLNGEEYATAAEEYKSEIGDILRKNEVKIERRGCLVGIVVSDKNLKSISIKVDREKYFPKYDAILKRSKKFMAHDEHEVCGMGDLVRIIPCRPMSKMKRHRVLDIIKKGDRLDIELTPEQKRRDPNKYYPE